MILAELLTRGFTVQIDIAGKLRIGPANRLTPALRAAIKASRDGLYKEVLARRWAEFEPHHLKWKERASRGR